MLYNAVFLLYSKMNQTRIHLYPLSFEPPSLSGHHRELEFPVIYSMFSVVIHLIHSINSIYVLIPISQFLPPHPLCSWYPLIYSLPLSLYVCFANRIIYTILLTERLSTALGLPWWLRWQRICLDCGEPEFNPWVRKIPWRRAWQPTSVFLPGESLWTEEPGRLPSMGSQRVGHD